MNSVQVMCAGCSLKHIVDTTSFYRKKRWCGNEDCKRTIDDKVKHKNYKKAQKKKENGTFRHGVNPGLREVIKIRDDFKCCLCNEIAVDKKPQVHHIIPVSDGGTDDVFNLVLLCYHCHVKIHKDGWHLYKEKFLTYTSKV